MIWDGRVQVLDGIDGSVSGRNLDTPYGLDRVDGLSESWKSHVTCRVDLDCIIR